MPNLAPLIFGRDALNCVQVLAGLNLRNNLFREPGAAPPPTRNGANIDAFPLTAFSTVGNVTEDNTSFVGPGAFGKASSNGSVNAVARDPTIGYPLRLHDVCLLIVRQHSYLALVYFALESNPGLLDIPLPCLNASAQLIKEEFDRMLVLKGLRAHPGGIQNGFDVDYAAGYSIGATQLCFKPDLASFGTDYLYQLSGRACSKAPGSTSSQRKHLLLILIPSIVGGLALVAAVAVLAVSYTRRG